MNTQHTRKIIYCVTTEKGTYNSVSSVAHFIHTVRPNNNDFTKIVNVSEWISTGWINLDPKEWVENNA